MLVDEQVFLLDDAMLSVEIDIRGCRTLFTATVLAVVFGGWAAAGAPADDGNWPRWRGPHGSGHSDAENLPVRWDDGNLVWKTKLAGSGQSSPIVWGDHIFLTAARNTDDGNLERLVICLQRSSGKLLWERAAWTGPPEPTHRMNMYASATCVTDGQRVVAFFGRGGIHCFDLQGERLWSRDLGALPGPWGTAASPLIVDDVVIQNCDAEENARLIGLDKSTGDIRWETPRENLRGWCSPILVEAARREVVINGELGVNAYDPATGDLLWFCRGDRGRGTPTVAPYKDLLIAVSGRAGDMIAVRPGGNGVVNATHEVWRTTRRGGRDLPSPIVVGDYLVVVSLRPGTATCYHAATGTELHTIRLGGNFSASPIAAGGLIYIPNEEGVTWVVRPGEKLEVVARNAITCGDDEIFRASLTPHNDQILCRSDKVLYCIGK